MSTDITSATNYAVTDSIDPLWNVVQNGFDPRTQRHLETILTSGNGSFATRGSMEEGYPGNVVTTFAHEVWDSAPVFETELANLPNWLETEITVDGERFRLDSGETLSFMRRLDLQNSLLERRVRWRSPSGKQIDLHFERFISYVDTRLALLRIRATAVAEPLVITIHSGLDGHVANQDLLHWRPGGQGERNGVVWLQAQTRRTGIEMAAALAVQSSTAGQQCDLCPGHPRISVTQTLQAGETLQVDKAVAYAFSVVEGQTGDTLIATALASARAADYDRARAAHVAAWQALWRDADVQIEGDDEAQLALRHSLYQLIIAAPQHSERASIGAKTLSGFGYRHHVFWDTEIFILPFFSYVLPKLARNMLMYRYHTLPGARAKAADNGFAGAQFAWESAATGHEVTPTWVPHPTDRTQLVRIWTGDIQVHITADIAYAIKQYWDVTGDDLFMRDYGAEIILDSARFWGSRVEREETADGHQYAIRNVIGPDEYHDHIDNNTFTNRMCQWHLELAFDILAWLEAAWPDKAAGLGAALALDEATLAHWQDVIDNIVLLVDPESRLMLQFEDFFAREYVDLRDYANRTQSMQEILGIEGANRAQVLKQADVVMLMCLHRDAYDAATWRINYDTYMPRTDHSYGSSLSPSFHAWAAAEMNRLDEAYDHFMLAARADISNIRGNANDGIHAASAGGMWQAVVFGFAGLRLTDDGYTLDPRLPDGWQRIAFNFYHNGERHAVEIRR